MSESKYLLDSSAVLTFLVDADGPDHRLSLADAIIAAYAQQQGAVLVHKDPELEAMTAVQQEALPYKA